MYRSRGRQPAGHTGLHHSIHYQLVSFLLAACCLTTHVCYAFHLHPSWPASASCAGSHFVSDCVPRLSLTAVINHLVKQR